ncbi:hypothetical protein [Pseudoalteromonas umbrosa]|uniref:hypothetical protein n=1 Tax=Pseudoalteromonas umbrosa TaxID=3048489 RepID=UPI0024C22CE9|nr:hypothetical protein [Pseudoalteromonas sp. B95]MDK1286959.1 hypothetical protein [Pseudoalteromonas sp. B95]
MSAAQTLLLVQAESEFDQAVVDHYLSANVNVILIAPSAQFQSQNVSLPSLSLAEIKAQDEPDIQLLLTEKGMLDSGKPLVVIQGVQCANEQALFTDGSCLAKITTYLDNTFLIYQSLATFVKEVGANIVFPLYSDSLSYLGQEVNSVANHALNAFMKTLARELTSDTVFINSAVIPYLAKDEAERKKMRRALKRSVFGMRPTVFLQQEFIEFIAHFSHYNNMMTGQCMTMRPSTEISV